MTIVFRNEGFTVRDVTTSVEALQAALCRKVKSNMETAGVRCVLWSSVPNLAGLARAARADAWVVKPTDFDDIVARVKELASGRGLT